MDLLLSILFSIIGYFVLLLITTNLTGMIMRGFFVQDTDFEDFVKKGRPRPYTKTGISMGNSADKRITIISTIITIVFLYLIYRFLNIWAVLAALLLIISRVHDLFWEIRTGKKVTTKERSRGVIHAITTIMIWAALPVLWWSLYNL